MASNRSKLLELMEASAPTGAGPAPGLGGAEPVGMDPIALAEGGAPPQGGPPMPMPGEGGPPMPGGPMPGMPMPGAEPNSLEAITEAPQLSPEEEEMLKRELMAAAQQQMQGLA